LHHIGMVHLLKDLNLPRDAVHVLLLLDLTLL
jgi:hypothetical protein